MMDKLKQFFDDRLGKFQHLIGRAELYEIIEAWNTRHPHQQIAEAIKQIDIEKDYLDLTTYLAAPEHIDFDDVVEIIRQFGEACQSLHDARTRAVCEESKEQS